MPLRQIARLLAAAEQESRALGVTADGVARTRAVLDVADRSDGDAAPLWGEVVSFPEIAIRDPGNDNARDRLERAR